MFIKNIMVTNERRVVTDTKNAAYSLSLSKASAKMEVMAEAGSADIITAVFIGMLFTGMEEVLTNRDAR